MWEDRWGCESLVCDRAWWAWRGGHAPGERRWGPAQKLPTVPPLQAEMVLCRHCGASVKA